MMKIETERLYIRHFVNEDASICFEGWGTDEHLGDFIMGYPMNMDCLLYTSPSPRDTR